MLYFYFRHEIDRQREAALLAKLQEERRKQQEQQKIQVSSISLYEDVFKVVEHVEENLNKLDIGTEVATNIDAAIAALGGDDEEFDKHPEKRMKAAYLVCSTSISVYFFRLSKKNASPS